MNTPGSIIVHAKRWILVLLLGAVSGAEGLDRITVDLDYIRGLADERAQKPYKERRDRLPSWLKDLDYSQYRDIRFLPEQALWVDEGLPFQVQFFHPGGLYQQPVEISEFSDAYSQEIPFVSDFFTYGSRIEVGHLSRNLGYAGFRLHHPLNRPGYFDELIVFLGASYFRALGMGQAYGLSARGVAVNTGLGGPEEFPSFVAFWLGKPENDATSITVFALLDGPSLTGAFRFRIIPGETSVVEVAASLFMRQEVDAIGLAPLTSMFWYGENTIQAGDDFRPEVHDSDGLAIRVADDNWIWRPLNNPPSLQATDFPVSELKGFGLLQRDRDFDHFQDFEANFQLRPTAWVEPNGAWGPGKVRLVELPTGNEYMDNVVAFWMPEEPLRPGVRCDLEYTILWALDRGVVTPVGRAVSSRSGSLPGNGLSRLFVVEFAGSHLAGMAMDSPIDAVIGIPEGARFLHSEVKKNPVADTWRVSFGVEAMEGGKPIDLHCHLRSGFDTLTETWVYRWYP